MLQNYYSSSESNTKLKTLGCRALYQQCQYFCTFGKLSLVSMHDIVKFLRSFILTYFREIKLPSLMKVREMKSSCVYGAQVE